ncbi:Tfp pilus assembly protein FimT/FimU [Acinetobacter sp.]|uniref:pilus assembly FimT family protein n=1 Tax=Acinetobacter sp. TaxID=472 RepID=UPI0035B163F8
MHKSRGFTLIELMVTIAVMAIVTMIAAPSFRDMQQKQNLNRSAQDLLGMLQQARAKAALERREVTVDLITQKDRLDKNQSLLANDEKTIYWLPEGKVILKSGSPEKIIFQLNGGIKNYDANIKDKPFKICDKAGGNKSKNISLSLMGTIHVTEGTC